MHLFLSHAHDDRIIAESIATLIGRLTLGQVQAWYSSDLSPVTGLTPGMVWLEEIGQKIAQSAAMIILLTPRSVDRPWLYFEAGVAAAKPQSKIVPLCIGLNSMQHVPMPLALYQSYQLEDATSLMQFLRKIVPLCGVPFDEEMAEPLVKKAVAVVMGQLGIQGQEDRPLLGSDVEKIVLQITSHLDRRLVELRRASDSVEPIPLVTSAATEHAIRVSTDPQEGQRAMYLHMSTKEKVQDVLDRIYNGIAGRVPPFTYMIKWVLRERKSGMVVGSRKSLVRLHATEVFTNGSEYEVVLLDRPFAEKAE